MLSDKKSNLLVTGLLVRGIKINISVAFIEQFYFIVPKNVRLYSTRDCIMKIPNKLQPQQISFNHSPDIDFKYFMNF